MAFGIAKTGGFETTGLDFRQLHMKLRKQATDKGMDQKAELRWASGKGLYAKNKVWNNGERRFAGAFGSGELARAEKYMNARSAVARSINFSHSMQLHKGEWIGDHVINEVLSERAEAEARAALQTQRGAEQDICPQDLQKEKERRLKNIRLQIADLKSIQDKLNKIVLDGGIKPAGNANKNSHLVDVVGYARNARAENSVAAGTKIMLVSAADRIAENMSAKGQDQTFTDQKKFSKYALKNAFNVVKKLGGKIREDDGDPYLYLQGGLNNANIGRLLEALNKQGVDAAKSEDLYNIAWMPRAINEGAARMLVEANRVDDAAGELVNDDVIDQLDAMPEDGFPPHAHRILVKTNQNIQQLTSENRSLVRAMKQLSFAEPTDDDEAPPLYYADERVRRYYYSELTDNAKALDRELATLNALTEAGLGDKWSAAGKAVQNLANAAQVYCGETIDLAAKVCPLSIKKGEDPQLERPFDIHLPGLLACLGSDRVRTAVQYGLHFEVELPEILFRSKDDNRKPLDELNRLLHERIVQISEGKMAYLNLVGSKAVSELTDVERKQVNDFRQNVHKAVHENAELSYQIAKRDAILGSTGEEKEEDQAKITRDRKRARHQRRALLLLLYPRQIVNLPDSMMHPANAPMANGRGHEVLIEEDSQDLLANDPGARNVIVAGKPRGMQNSAARQFGGMPQDMSSSSNYDVVANEDDPSTVNIKLKANDYAGADDYNSSDNSDDSDGSYLDARRYSYDPDRTEYVPVAGTHILLDHNAFKAPDQPTVTTQPFMAPETAVPKDNISTNNIERRDDNFVVDSDLPEAETDSPSYTPTCQLEDSDQEIQNTENDVFVFVNRNGRKRYFLPADKKPDVFHEAFHMTGPESGIADLEIQNKDREFTYEEDSKSGGRRFIERNRNQHSREVSSLVKEMLQQQNDLKFEEESQQEKASGTEPGDDDSYQKMTDGFIGDTYAANGEEVDDSALENNRPGRRANAERFDNAFDKADDDELSVSFPAVPSPPDHADILTQNIFASVASYKNIRDRWTAIGNQLTSRYFIEAEPEQALEPGKSKPLGKSVSQSSAPEPNEAPKIHESAAEALRRNDAAVQKALGFVQDGRQDGDDARREVTDDLWRSMSDLARVHDRLVAFVGGPKPQSNPTAIMKSNLRTARLAASNLSRQLACVHDIAYRLRAPDQPNGVMRGMERYPDAQLRNYDPKDLIKFSISGDAHTLSRYDENVGADNRGHDDVSEYRTCLNEVWKGSGSILDGVNAGAGSKDIPKAAEALFGAIDRALDKNTTLLALFNDNTFVNGVLNDRSSNYTDNDMEAIAVTIAQDRTTLQQLRFELVKYLKSEELKANEAPSAASNV